MGAPFHRFLLADLKKAEQLTFETEVYAGTKAGRIMDMQRTHPRVKPSIHPPFDLYPLLQYCIFRWRIEKQDLCVRFALKNE